MKTLKSLISLLVIIAVGFCLIACSQKATPMVTKKDVPKPVVLIDHKPAWLLVGGEDVRGEDVPGDRIETGMLTGIGGYNVVGKPTIEISYHSGGRIVFWKGKGEITNLRTGEKILLPLSPGK